MINKKLEKLLEEAIAKKQELKESELGSAAAKPVHTEEKPEEHTPEMENKDVFPAEEHEQSEEVEAPVIESYTREDLEELFESLELDTDKYTFEYLAEELGFEPLNEISDKLARKVVTARMLGVAKEGLKKGALETYNKLLNHGNKLDSSTVDKLEDKKSDKQWKLKKAV
jgi:hypothetical protein